MSKRPDSALSIRPRKSLVDSIFEFVTYPFVWIRGKIRARRNDNEHFQNVKSNRSNEEPFLILPSKNSQASLPVTDIVKSYPDDEDQGTSRTPQASFLFVGLGGSGISTIASTLFGFHLDDSSVTDSRDIYFREISQQLMYSSNKPKMNLKIIDVPGLCKDSYAEEDAEIITALNNHLKQSLTNQIPTVTFIVTQFEDNRFEGEASQFSKMLTAISYSRKYWTDSKLSNVSLVLAHKSKIDASEISNKVFRFQHAFSQVYPEMSHVHSIVVDLEDIHSARSLLSSAISSIARRRDDLDNAPEEFLELLKYKKWPAEIHIQNVQDRSISLQSLLPQNEREVKTLQISLLQGKVNEYSTSEPNEDEAELCPYFVDYFGKRIHPLSVPVAVSILRPSSKVLLFDGKTKIDVQSLRVGDKILNMNLSSNVVSSIKMIQTCENDYNGQPIGLLLPGIQEGEESTAEDNDDECRSNPLVLKYHNNSIRQMEFKESAIQNYKSQRFFIVDLDTSNGTFIVDDYILYAKYDSALAM